MAGKWGGPFFVPPELFDVVRDFVFAKGDQYKIHSPGYLVRIALEDYLSRNGYKAQVDEFIQSRKEKRGIRVFSRDRLTVEQRQAVDLVKRYEHLDEQGAIKWVLDHPKEVEQSLEPSS